MTVSAPSVMGLMCVFDCFCDGARQLLPVHCPVHTRSSLIPVGSHQTGFYNRCIVNSMLLLWLVFHVQPVKVQAV